tara:strand:+ start:1949 stop:2308 length:360 start_codon:yes stop_codon:yes gene_type:complete
VERIVNLATIHQRGLWAESIAHAHFATKRNLLVFPSLQGVGLCDFMTLDIKTGEVKKYDVKYGGTRFLYNRNNKTGNGGMRLIHRVQSKKQKQLGIEIIYVMEDGTIRQPKKRKLKNEK